IGWAAQRALDANQYYRGLQGLQSGQRFTKDTWDDVLQELRAGAAAAQKPRDYYRWQLVNSEGEVFPIDELAYKIVNDRTRAGFVRRRVYDVSIATAQGYSWQSNLIKGQRQRIPWLQHTYLKRVRPRRGTAEWWRRETDGFTNREITAYRSLA